MSAINSARSSVWIVLPFLVASIAGTAAFRLSMPVVAYYVRETLYSSMIEVSLLTIAFLLARALSSVIAGRIVDKVKRAIVLIVLLGFTINGLITVLYAYISSWIEAIVLRLMQGALNGFTWPTIQFVVASISPIKWRGRILATYFALGSIGLFAGDLIYSFMANMPALTILSISSLMFITSAISSVLGSISYLKEDFKEEESVEANTGSFGASSVDVHSSLLLSILIAGFTVMYMSAIVSGDFAYVYFRETLVLSRSETALILGITGFIGVIASFAVSWFSDRYSENNTLILVFGISIIAPILLLFNTLATVCISLILIGVAVKSFNPLSRKYATHFLKAATVIGLLNATGNIGRAIGQLVLGYAYDVIDAQTISLSVFRILELPLLLTLPLPALLWSATILYRRKLT